MSGRVVAVALTVGAVACGGGDDGADLDLGVIDEAMAAVDAERGGPQRYFEVTVNAQVVRLFVQDDALVDARVDAQDGSQVVTYAWVDGELAESGRPQSAAGETFTAADLAFDPATILDEVATEAPDATVEEFSVVGTRSGPPRYAVFARSDAGGVLDITLADDGEVLEVAPASLRR